MDAAYDPERWQALMGATAPAAAALTGLLFVALSVNARSIMDSDIQEARAVETLATLLALVVIAVTVLIPGQTKEVLGVELMGVTALLAVTGFLTQRRTLGRMEGGQRRFWAVRLAILDVGTAGILIAGISCTVGRLGGLYWLVPTLLLYVIWASTNAWVLLLHGVRPRR